MFAGPKMNPRDTSGCSQKPSPSHKITETGENLSRGVPFFRSLLGVITDPDGIEQSTQSASPCVAGGSGLTIVIAGAAYPGFIACEPALRQDPNGNQISTSCVNTGQTVTTDVCNLTDTVGRVIPFPLSTTNYGGCTGPQPITSAYVWNLPAPSGGTAPVTLCFMTYQIPTYTTIHAQQTVTYQSIQMLQSVLLADRTSWIFQYSSDGYANLTQITYPTGATISYGYSRGGGYCSTVPESAFDSYPAFSVTSRTVHLNDGVTPAATWTYSYIPSGFDVYGGSGPPVVTTTATDPLGGQEVHVATGLGSAPTYSCSLYETSATTYSPSGALLETETKTYSYSPSGFNADGSVSNVLLTSETTTWPSGKTNQVTMSYDPGFSYTSPDPAVGGTFTASYGRLVKQVEIDYTGTVLRTTNTTYAWQSPNPNYSSYLSNNLLNTVASVQITDSGGTQRAYTTYGHDESSLQSSGVTEQHISGEAYLGNQTLVHRWLSNGSAAAQSPCNVSVASGGYLVTNNIYFDTGELQKSTDPCLYPTSYLYSSTYYGSLPTTVTNALSQNTTYGYDFNTGLVTSVTDPNSQTTTKTYDIMGRLTSVAYPDGGSTGYCYTDMGGATCSQVTSPPYSVVTTKAITSKLNETSTIVFDGLDRPSQTQLNSDPSGATYTLATYDALGRKSQVYNPTRCSSITSNCKNETTWGYTTTYYDPLNRVTSVGEQDGSTVSTNYSAFPCTTVTDEVGNSRTSCVDGLGRMTGVWENPSGLNYETDYAYDALNNLLSVTQKGSNSSNARTRSFQYDSLLRLTSAANPESGTITYGYDADGNVITKTALSPNQSSTGTATVTTAYTYDMLNRPTQKSYNDGYTLNSPTPGASYAYDGKSLTGCTIAPPGLTDSYPVGRRTSMCDGSGGTSWSHDTMGRLLQERRTIGTIKGEYENDAFNLDGSVASMTSLGYGVNYTYSGAARPLTALQSATNLVTAATYAPPGELAGMTLGSATGFAGITVADAYSDRLQPILLSAASPSATVFSECFDFHLGVGVTGPSPCSFSANAAGDNGNVYQIVNNRDNTRNQNFIYDSLNRIEQAYSSGTQWGETFGPTATSPGVAPTTPGIDSWGNLTNRSGVTGKTNLEPLSVSAGTNNQLSGFGYDAAGNMTSNGSASYVYDNENRLIATAGDSYIYDGDGQRVEKCTEGTTPGTCATSATGTLYWRGSGSAPLTETDLSGTVKTTYIFFNGQRVARSDSAGLIHFYFSDHLGSHGVVENATGSACEQDIDYYPYGGVENDYCPNVAQNYKFTGKERDGESGLDNFGARYNASSMGRFMTPDPVSATPFHLINPQRWNMYSYVVNNPLTYVDPDGMDAIAVNFTKEVPLGGHEGIISVQADGTAQYARFGPVHSDRPADQGKVDVQSLSSVNFKSDGLPTDASYKQLTDQVAKIEGQDPSTVRLNYFKTSSADTAALVAWIARIKAASDAGKAPDYDVSSQNCATFCRVGLIQANAISAKSKLSNIPNVLFHQLSLLALENYVNGQRSPKEDNTHKIIYPAKVVPCSNESAQPEGCN